MMHDPWSLQDAKARFSAVVEAAMGGEAQLVTRRGKKAVVVIDASEYERLIRGERTPLPSFIEHLLAIPRERGGGPKATVDRRAEIKLRDVKFR